MSHLPWVNSSLFGRTFAGIIIVSTALGCSHTLTERARIVQHEDSFSFHSGSEQFSATVEDGKATYSSVKPSLIADILKLFVTTEIARKD